MLVHFLAVGLLFFYPILGVDPGPRRANPVLGILELFGGMPFHAFFGIAVMMSSALTTTVFTHHPATWPGSPLSDEHAAGAIAWAFAEIPSVAGPVGAVHAVAPGRHARGRPERPSCGPQQRRRAERLQRVSCWARSGRA